MAVESRGDLASRHGRVTRIAVAHSCSYRSDNPICTRTRCETFHGLLACIVDSRFGDVIEECMGFPVDDAIALLDRSRTDGLSQMTLAGAGWTEKHSIFTPR